MGREIRRVPANWQHPMKPCKHSPWRGGCDESKRNGGQCYQPLYDQDYETAAKEWLDGCIAWRNKTHEDYSENFSYYWDYAGNPPDEEYYRPKMADGDRTWVQVYETVSEGTPVTPAFATKNELIDYLVTNGDFWDQLRGDGGWTRENATEFVGNEWAPSMTAIATQNGVKILEPRDGQSA
jgi:hypothetical protein